MVEIQEVRIEELNVGMFISMNAHREKWLTFLGSLKYK